jgi:DMSO/TMAO reductase YedYZ molybdopterin-dependent catalytic subunit
MDTLMREHAVLTRRYFLSVLGASAAFALSRRADARPESLTPKLEYLTGQEMFGTVERGDPLPYMLPPAALARAGLTEATWRLDVISDPAHPAQVDRELRHREGTALRFADLLEIGKTKSVRFLKTITCANGSAPLGTGLWEGVPLREVIARTGLARDCRRIFYQGFHNADVEQVFRSSLSADRVFEDPLGTPPVILAYRLNGEPISGKRGGPVRLIVPEAYGFKNVKWLNLVVLSNRFTSNDTYAIYNNTTESWMKTFARFVSPPEGARAGAMIPLSGIAQAGTSGLARVQVLALPGEHVRDDNDPYFARRVWRDAALLEPPEQWGGGLPASDVPAGSAITHPAFGFSATTRRPIEWPMRFTTAHWAMVHEGLRPGRHTLYCRTIDRDGNAQPMPRVLQNSGRNVLDRMTIEVTPA